MTTSTPADQVTAASAAIRGRIDAAVADGQLPEGFQPRVAVVLGSGLGAFADNVEQALEVPYDDLPGFPAPGVAGHQGRLLLGRVGATQVAVLQGRAHYYEHGRPDAMLVPVRTLKAIGVDTLLLTNAAGSLLPEAAPGSIMALKDHINFTGVSPLFGTAGDGRFVDMADAYDPTIRERFNALAGQLGVRLHHGVYAWMCGPNFETRAEVEAVRRLGADAVGMSTVPETILARHQGLRVGALSIMTNYAAGMSQTELSHEQTMQFAAQAAEDVQRLLTAFLTDLVP